MSTSIKIAERKLTKNDLQNNAVNNMSALIEKITKGNEASKKEFLSPERRPDGRYVTSEASLNKWIDLRIFRETQIKRFLRWLTTSPPLLNLFFNWLLITKLRMKLSYFDQREDQNPDKRYKQGEQHTINEREEDFRIHNLGHATQLIQISDMNILTDPVFGNLAPLFYPKTTKEMDYHANDLPPIDVILISHNHRDHVDVDSLKKLIKNSETLPKLLVPMGDEDFFKGLGFTDVEAFEWHEEITFKSKSDQFITFCSTPADHRSGRHGYDAHRSLVMGWAISPKSRNEILYFAGDTAKIDDIRMKGLALDIYQLYQHKEILLGEELPKLINMEPGGPNYTRKDMKPTHQSAVDSIVSSFRLAVALNEISTLHNEISTLHMGENPKSADSWLEATATVFMHHNKYELGPDRCNESVYIYDRLLSYLKMSDEHLQTHLNKQQAKSTGWSLFHRRKDFIIDGVKELRELGQQIWPEEGDPKVRNEKIIAFIQAKIHFPLINEKLSPEDYFKFKPGELSTIIPDTYVTSKDGEKKRKGDKRREIMVQRDIVSKETSNNKFQNGNSYERTPLLKK